MLWAPHELQEADVDTEIRPVAAQRPDLVRAMGRRVSPVLPRGSQRLDSHKRGIGDRLSEEGKGQGSAGVAAFADGQSHWILRK